MLFLLKRPLVAVPEAGVIVVSIAKLAALQMCATPAALVVIKSERSGEYSMELMLLL